MAKVTVSRPIFEKIEKHLEKIKGERKTIIDQCFPLFCRERDELELMLQEYIAEIEKFVKNTRVSGKDNNNLPYVIIGSDVEVQNLENDKTLCFRLVYPSQGSRRKGEVSFLSPIGSSLLLKKIGDKVEVKAPGGTFRFEVKSIQIEDV